MKAVISSAGLGTILICQPKHNQRKCYRYGKPAIQNVMEEAMGSGIDDILIVMAEIKRLLKTTSTSHVNLNTLFKNQVKTGLKTSQINHRSCRHMICRTEKLKRFR